MKKCISIIVATYNAQSYLSKCLDSIVAQKTEDVELIIIDGKSSDNTVNVIRQYERYIDKWISEEDDGIYDAWNKGIRLSVGDWIQFIGADDTYVENALCEYLEFIKKYDCRTIDIASANVLLYTPSGKLINNKGKAYSWNEFKYYMSIPHPSVLHSKHFLDKDKMFDTNYRSSGDYELIYRGGMYLRTVYFDKPVVNFYLGGTSFSLMGLIETYQIYKKYHQISVLERLFMFAKGFINLIIKRIIWR